MDELKRLSTLLGPLIALASSVWYISSIFNNIDGRINKLDSKIDNILVQIQAQDEVEYTKYDANQQVLEDKIKACGCDENIRHTQA